MDVNKIDQHLNAVLRAAGSALRHYSLPKSLDDMRAAMKAAIDDATSELQARVTKLEAERAEREKQEPVAHEYQGSDGIWRGFINQQHYKNTVEDGSWPIRALYAAPPVTAPVRLTCEQIGDRIAAALRANGFEVGSWKET